MSTYLTRPIDLHADVSRRLHRTRVRENSGRSAADVVARLLAVLVVAMVLTSIVGLTVVGDRNTTAAVVAGVIGMSSAVLGLLFGYLKAYQVSESPSG